MYEIESNTQMFSTYIAKKKKKHLGRIDAWTNGRIEGQNSMSRKGKGQMTAKVYNCSSYVLFQYHLFL